MKTKVLHSLGSLFGLFLFSVALWVLHHQLKTYSVNDILRYLEELHGNRLFSALAFTFLSYLVMTGYDALALRYIHHPLSYSKTALASFIGYAFSNNIGFSMIAGASVRYRLYSEKPFRKKTDKIPRLSYGFDCHLYLGILVVFLGTLVGLLSIYRFLKTEREIMKDTYHPSIAADVLIALLLGAIGILVVIYLFNWV